MAFDLNSKPQDLRPINVIRNVADDTRMAPVITSGRPIEGFYANPTRDLGGNHNPLPVYYPSTVPDTGFVPIGFNNVVPNGWVRHVVPSQFQPGISPTVLNSGVGYTNSPMFGARSDHASEDGGDESVSGRKVKFLCSFGGTIMPRPSDSALRYAGGQTRIISVRRDISFSELVQKMMEIYAQDVVIKYQLPDEELDALVSVSCPEDLENMMDEYEKFVERSVDGSSAKLRIFLFSSSDLESPLHDGGYRYLEAINGFVDDFGGSGGEGGGRIARKESIESSAAGASQASDFSGMDGGDGLSHVHGEVTSLPSPVCFSPNIPSETAPRMMYMDQNPVLYTDSSGALSSVPMVQPAPTTVLGSEQAVDRPVGSTAQQQQPGVSFPVSSPYVQVQQTYQDPRQETFNRGTFVQLPAQMGFPGQMFGPAGPMFSQVGHMAMNQPSFVNMRPGPIGGPAIVQPQQVHLDNFPAGSMVSQRVVPFSTDQGYGAPKVQISAAIQQGGVYGWHQIPHPEVARSEGLNPQPILTPDKVPRLEDCFMCQKQLPHAHSDTVAKELKESPFFDSRSIYQSLHLDNRGRPVVTGTSNDDNIESGKIQTEGQRMNDKTVLQKVEVPEHSLVTHPHGVAVTSGIPSPYGVFVAKSPQPYQANAAYHVVGQPQFQVVHDNTAVERPSINDFVPVHESPRDYYGNVSDGSPKDDSTSLAYDHLRQIDGRLENLHIRPSEILANNEQTIARKIDALEIRAPPQVAIRDNPNMHNVSPVDSYEVVEPPLMHGVNHLVANDNTVHPVYPGNCQDNILRSQPLVSGDKGKNVTSISSSYGVGDVQDNSASLFSNQDPWNLQNDTQCPPPRPSKLQMRKESTVPRDPLGESRLMNRSESPIGNGRDSPLGEGAHEFSGNLNRDLSSNKGSAEELIKQELQAVAEGVAASVLQSSGPSNPDLLAHGTSDSSLTTQQNKEVYRDKLEEVKTKLPEKANLGFPASDGIGRLQIIRNSDLEELRELGSGTFGTVYHGKWRGTDVAIKRINDRCFAAKPSEQERMRDDFWNEAVKLADLHHPNVVAFYGVVLDGPDGSVATVTEYMVNGSLRNALQKNERNLDKRKRLLIGMDVAFGMEYLHGKNIVHFDLKSDNLLVNLRDPHRPICKVGDLGLSKVKCQTLISGGVRGTLPWMAPELLNGSSSLVSEKVDVFSFGIVMWELLTGEEPYADLHYGAIIGGIVSNTLRPPVPETCDPMWRALMERCWAPEPKERPNFTQIANELRAMAAKLPAKA